MGKPRTPIKTSGPMGPEQLDTLNRLLASTAETGRFCDQCEAAGLDVTPEKRKNAEQQEVAQKMKRAFYPDAT